MITGATALAIEIASLREQLKEAERQRDELLDAIEQYVTMPAFDGTQETSKIRLAAKYRLAAARKEQK